MAKKSNTEKAKGTERRNFLVDERIYKLKPEKEALIVTGVYGVFGMLWIILSDSILDLLVKDIEHYKQIQTYKGWIYVGITIVLIYSLVLRRSRTAQKATKEMVDAYTELQVTCEELVATEEELIDQKKLNENIFEDAQVIIATWDESGNLSKLNPYGLRLLGYEERDVIGKPWSEFTGMNEGQASINQQYKFMQGFEQNFENQFISNDHKRVDIIWNNSQMNYFNKPSELLSIGTDITDRKVLEEKLRTLAYFDELTSLPKRSYILEDMSDFIENRTPFAIFHVNIDNFKQINDTLGYSVGDTFLMDIANRFKEYFHWPNRVARLAADDFLVFYADDCSEDAIKSVLQKLPNQLGKSWEANHHEFFVSYSIGVTLFPKDGDEPNTLFRNANIAMSEAKKEGKGRYLFYTEEMIEDSIERTRLANQLKYAIVNNELQLYYQPQINLSTGSIIGFEALVRWLHPELGSIPPATFIPIAEETGQIYEIERWIIQSALNQKKMFEQNNFDDLIISINLSSKSLAGTINFSEIEKILNANEIDYSKICIEITETAIISDMEGAVDKLKKLRAYGIKIALDDFGTGYSSLIHLKELPIHIVKLDRSFIKNIDLDEKSSQIIKAIMELVYNMNLEVVAEGIETVRQLEYLKGFKCQIGQGYLMSRPVPVDQVHRLLHEGFRL